MSNYKITEDEQMLLENVIDMAKSVIDDFTTSVFEGANPADVQRALRQSVESLDKLFQLKEKYMPEQEVLKPVAEEDKEIILRYVGRNWDVLKKELIERGYSVK